MSSVDKNSCPGKQMICYLDMAKFSLKLKNVEWKIREGRKKTRLK